MTYTSLIERLQHRARFDTAESPYRLMDEAATALATQAKRIDELEAGKFGTIPTSTQVASANYRAKAAERERDEWKSMYRREAENVNALNEEAQAMAAERDELRRALEHCLMEHGGFTIRGETERPARAALSQRKEVGE